MFVRRTGDSFALLCQAQAYPVPLIRCVLYHMHYINHDIVGSDQIESFSVLLILLNFVCDALEMEFPRFHRSSIANIHVHFSRILIILSVSSDLCILIIIILLWKFVRTGRCKASVIPKRIHWECAEKTNEPKFCIIMSSSGISRTVDQVTLSLHPCCLYFVVWKIARKDEYLS